MLLIVSSLGEVCVDAYIENNVNNAFVAKRMFSLLQWDPLSRCRGFQFWYTCTGSHTNGIRGIPTTGVCWPVTPT